ncbi:hypothetical protein BJV77DRAFT_82646 [Russula vinacea]|nr:hypothetical protein BJV77DRAFT_82646 [Russula vinacea]
MQCHRITCRPRRSLPWALVAHNFRSLPTPILHPPPEDVVLARAPNQHRPAPLRPPPRPMHFLPLHPVPRTPPMPPEETLQHSEPEGLLISPLTTLLLAQQVALMTNTLLPSMHFFHQRLRHSPIPRPCRATRSQNLTWGRSALMMSPIDEAHRQSRGRSCRGLFAPAPMPGNSRYVTSSMASDSLVSSRPRTPAMPPLYTIRTPSIPPPSTLSVWFQHPRVHPCASALDTHATPSTSLAPLLTWSRRVTHAGQMPCIFRPRHIRRAMQVREQVQGAWRGCRRSAQGEVGH